MSNKKNSNIIRLSFLGDIMFEKYIMNKNSEKTDFASMFKSIKPILKNSDIVIGNLETTFAGKKAVYTKEMYSFNTPDKAIESLKLIGLEYVSITNNHILDRGIDGRNRTIEILEKKGLNVLAKTREIDIINIDNIKISILPYTSSTNYADNKVVVNSKKEKEIRLLAPFDYEVSFFKPNTLKTKIYKILAKSIGHENLMKLLKLVGRKPRHPYIDYLKDNYEKELKIYVENVKNNIKYAKDYSDLVIVLPHMGGQFNKVPGDFSEYYMKIFKEEGVDIIIASHPHIIQKFSNENGVPAFYSIGNFSMAPNSTYIILDNHPEIGIIVHIDIDSSLKNIKDILITPIIMKINKNKELRIETLFRNKIDYEIVAWLEDVLEVKLENVSMTDFRIITNLNKM